MIPGVDEAIKWAVPKVLDLGWNQAGRWLNRRNATKEFVRLFRQELRNCGVDDKQIKQKKYDKYLGKLVSDSEIQALIAKSFESSNFEFDRDRLASIWTQKYQPSEVPFPDAFDWDSLIEKYQAAVKELRKRDKKEGEIIRGEATEANTAALKKIAHMPVGFDVSKYKTSLYESYGFLKLRTLDSNDENYRIKLWRMFIEQNVRESLQPSRFEIPQDYKQQLLKSEQLESNLKPEQVEQYSRQYLEKSAEPVLKAIDNEKCLRAVIVGDPGSGKSTLLQYLALDWAEGKTTRFPLLIELREYVNDRSQSKTFLDFLERSVRADCNFDRDKLDEHLQTKSSLVMFDGLDEIFDPQDYEAVVDEIAKFATQKYPKVKIIVTSRVVDYNPERLRDVNFQHFTLQNLNEAQIEEFIDKWHEFAMGGDPEKERLKQRMKEDIKNSPAIENLADNPLLLTLMAILNRRESLPRDRVALYEQASGVLLHNWDVDRKKLELPLYTIGRDEKQAMLRKIAYEMQSGEKGIAGNLIDAGRLKDILTDYLKPKLGDRAWETAGRLIEQLRSRNYILCDRGRDTYGFVHRTFLEYFCAKEIVLQFEKERSLSLEQLRDDIFDRHWQDKTWHEVMRLICGLLAPKFAGELVEFLTEREVERADHLKENKATKEAFQHLQLATECFAEIRDPESIPSIAAKLKQKLKNEIEIQSEILLSDEAAELLLESIAKYYDTEPETLSYLQNIGLDNPDESVRQAAVWSIAQYYHTQLETLTYLQNVVLDDPDESVRRAAVWSIAQYYHTQLETLTYLQNLVSGHEIDTVVRRVTIATVGQPEILIHLQTLAISLQDLDKSVRETAVRSIARYYHTKPETQIYLKDLVSGHDLPESVRQAAVWSIAQHYHTEPETITYLQTLVSGHDLPELVRWVVVMSIAAFYQTEPETITYLQNLVSGHDIPESVRCAAVESIAGYYQSKPETRTYLEDLVSRHDISEFVGGLAVASIAVSYQTDSETLSYLENLISRHELPEFVRQMAVVSIAQFYHSDETLSYLENLISGHELPELIRQTAVVSIAQFYHSDETLSYLENLISGHELPELIRQAAVVAIAQFYHTEPETLSYLENLVSSDDLPELVRQAAVVSIAQYYHTESETRTYLENLVSSDDLPESVRWKAVESIAQYYHTESKTLTYLKPLVACDDLPESVRHATVMSIAQYYHTEPDTLTYLENLLSRHDDLPEWVRRAAVWSIARYYHTKPETLTYLENLLSLNPLSELVQRAAVESIDRYYHTESNTLTYLQNRVSRHDLDEWIRRAAVESIAEHYHTEPETLTYLKTLAQDDPSMSVRWAADESIERYYPAKPETLTSLQNSVSCRDLNEWVRRAAVESIGEYYHTEPETLTYLQSLVSRDDLPEWVRRAAVESIGEYYHTEPEILIYLQTLVLRHDLDKWVRGAAVESIAASYHMESEILIYLQTLVPRHDLPELVRWAAVESIAQYYHTEPETRTYLEKLVSRHDLPELVRQTAMESIAQYYRTEPETLS
jgi:HEAT repeat protein/GTPase SAR1 family protein